eukprot:PITA_36254
MIFHLGTLHTDLRCIPRLNPRSRATKMEDIEKENLQDEHPTSQGFYNVTYGEVDRRGQTIPRKMNALPYWSSRPCHVEKQNLKEQNALAWSRPRTSVMKGGAKGNASTEYCKQTKGWYQLSKTLAEETAWEFAKEKGIDVVTINPAMVIGTLLQPTLNTSCAAILQIMNGSSAYPNATFGWVSVKDVAKAHILAFEVPSANGRYLLVERVAHLSEIVKILSKLYPGCTLPTKCADDNPFIPTYAVSKEKIEKLGLYYTSIEEAFRDTVESLKEKKLLNLDSNL